MNCCVESIKPLNCIEQFLILACMSSTIGLKIYAICGIKKYIIKSIIKKKKKEHDKIALLAKPKLNSIEVLISKVLTDPAISHDEFVLINYVLREYSKMKEEIKNFKT